MPKHIKMVDDLIRKAMQRGHASKGSYRAESGDGYFKLHHYGTEIVNVNGGFINNLGGYSVSDRDAISTTLRHFGHSGSVSSNQSLLKKWKAGKLPQAKNYNGWLVM